MNIANIKELQSTPKSVSTTHSRTFKAGLVTLSVTGDYLGHVTCNPISLKPDSTLIMWWSIALSLATTF